MHDRSIKSKMLIKKKKYIGRVDYIFLNGLKKKTEWIIYWQGQCEKIHNIKQVSKNKSSCFVTGSLLPLTIKS